MHKIWLHLGVKSFSNRISNISILIMTTLYIYFSELYKICSATKTIGEIYIRNTIILFSQTVFEDIISSRNISKIILNWLQILL